MRSAPVGGLTGLSWLRHVRLLFWRSRNTGKGLPQRFELVAERLDFVG